MKRLLLTLALALSASGQAAAEPVTYPMFTVSVRGGGLGVDYNEVTVFSTVWGLPQGSPDADLWIAERRRNDRQLGKPIADHQWIDGRTCPALLTALQTIRGLPPMRFGSPGDIGITGMAFDIPMRTLRAPPARDGGGGMSLSRSEYDGAIADWRRRLEAAIEPCWRDAPPSIPGVKIPEQLATVADAERWAR